MFFQGVDRMYAIHGKYDGRSGLVGLVETLLRLIARLALIQVIIWDILPVWSASWIIGWVTQSCFSQNLSGL